MLTYREDLDPSVCSHPSCAGKPPGHTVWFHAGCHLEAPTWVRYRDGALTITCSVCTRTLATIAVASRGRDTTGGG